MVSATEVKKLREVTGAGMMECKKALEKTGNFDLAIVELRKAGAMKAGKKASRIAADGIVIIRTENEGRSGSLVEINCETDFVARDQSFLEFANKVADIALKTKATEVAALLTEIFSNNESIEEARQALVAKIGENINIRRVAYLATSSGVLGTYVHGNRIGVMVELNGPYSELAKDIAMHVAASKPLVIAAKDVPEDLVAKEKEIYFAQASSSGKPEDIIEKMVNGRIKKYVDEVSLLGQPFVKDPTMTIASLLSKQRAEVVRFTRFEVGEGIEKEKEDFIAAVMSQVQGG